MAPIEFVWDKDKNRVNLRKHGISFEEARTIFFDENAKLIFDPDHSYEEERFILLGMSIKLRIIAVCHCYKESDAIIRIIMARKASKKEQKQYRG